MTRHPPPNEGPAEPAQAQREEGPPRQPPPPPPPPLTQRLQPWLDLIAKLLTALAAALAIWKGLG
jgi:hypothetical protein